MYNPVCLAARLNAVARIARIAVAIPTRQGKAGRLNA
jgi:hypothetical protein